MKNYNVTRYLLRTVGILCLLYGVTLLYFVRFSGLVLVWYVLGAALTALSVKKIFRTVFSRRWIRIVALACVAVVVILEGLIIAYGLGAPRESCDYIIVLGGSIVGEVPTQTLQYRLDTAYAYLVTHQETKAILSGGQGEGESISEAEAMGRFLANKGVDASRLIIEDQSEDTYENMRNSFRLIGDGKGLRVCVVSSDFHILRAKMLALKSGWQVDGLGARTYLPLIPLFHLREMLAIVKDLVIR